MVFYTDDRKIRPDLFDGEAKKWAEGMRHVSRRQMRRIYDEIKRLERKVEAKNDWEDVLPYIKMEKSKIVYTVARVKKNLGRDEIEKFKSYDMLKNFIFEGIDAVRENKDYSIFCQLFEAVFGFHYEIAPEN